MSETRRSNKPAVAVVTNVQTPYRLHFHRRIAAEMPEIRFLSAYTHGVADQAWAQGASAAEGETTACFGSPGEKVTDPPSARRDWAKGGRIAAWLHEHDARAVLVCGYNDASRLRLIRWCHATGRPCFLVADSNIYGDSARGAKRAVKSALVRAVTRRVTGVMPCGSFGAEYFARYGVPVERIFLVPYEPDYALIELLPASAVESARSAYGLDASRRRIVFCGRLAAVKRPDLALAAFAAAADRRPEWDLVMIGDGPLAAELRRSVPPALAGRVIWTGFIGDQTAVSAIYRASHLFLLPSDYEPWGVVVNEAAAAGLAIVTSRVVGAAGELVRDGINGRVFEPGDLRGLTAALLDATDPTRLPAMRLASRGVLEDWRRRADPIDGLRRALSYAGVIPAGTPRPSDSVNAGAR